MAGCDPAEAIWVVRNPAAGHAVLQALHDPPDGDPRVETTYAETTPLADVHVDQPGCTALYTVDQLHARLAE